MEYKSSLVDASKRSICKTFTNSSGKNLPVSTWRAISICQRNLTNTLSILLKIYSNNHSMETGEL